MVFIKTKKAKLNAANAHWENRTSMPKQHAVVVTLVRLAAAKVFVQHAHWVMPEKETTMVRLNVNNVDWVTQQRLKVPLNVKLVILEHLATPMVFVRNARVGFIKIPKGKQSAVIPVT
jgi:ribulose 1,5-bisphosphate carboxylase large subunit-like protein